MGSTIELNDTLQITTKQGLPAELKFTKHLQQPFTAASFSNKSFTFHDKKNIRVYHAPPIRVFLTHNIEGKRLHWGRVEVIESTSRRFSSSETIKFK